MSASPDIFLSYSRDDQATARRFAEGLEAQGFSVWWDATLRTGESYDQVTEKALNEAKAVVVLWSAKSVNSRWVRAEATMADRNKTLAPVMIEGCQRPIMFELTQTADLSHWAGDARDKAWQSFVVDLRELITQGKPGAVANADQSHRPAAATLWYRAKSFKVAIVAVPVVIAAALLYGYLRTPRAPGAANVSGAASGVVQSAPPTTPPAATPDADPRASVAVIPFANLTGDATKEYFSDGMAEELIDALAHIPGLKVPARTSSFAYKGRNTDIRKIAQDLNVGTILEGSVRSAGDRIRVTAQLVDAKSGFHLFSQSYDRKFADIFKLQDELAKSIVMAMRENLTEEQAASAIQGPPTQDVEAYRLYLQAGAVTDTDGTELGFRHALTLLDQAIARDPKFARAFARRADVRLTFLVVGYPMPNALVDAERDAAQALALDPKLAVALSVRGMTQALHGNWSDAETSHRQAIAADKTDGAIRINYADSTLQSVGHLREALSELQEAYRLAPGSLLNTVQLAAIYSLMGRDADAVKLMDLAVEMGLQTNVVPIPQIYANAATHAGHYAEAADRLAPTLSPAMREAGGREMLQLTSAARGDPTKRKAALASLLRLRNKLAAGDIDVNLRKFFLSEFAEVGALDEAYEMANLSLDEYLRGGTVGNTWGFLWVAEMRPFRQDPRFQAFVTRLKLMDYWMQHGPPDGCDLTDGKLICH